VRAILTDPSFYFKVGWDGARLARTAYAIHQKKVRFFKESSTKARWGQ
jgi:hypothetical protein